MEVKKERNICMGVTRRNLFLGSKMKTNPNSFSDPKGEVSNLKASFKNRADKIFIWTAMKSRQSDMIFYFVKIGFSPIKSPNSSRKSIIFSFINHEISTLY
jgi:hypothetical protein